MTLLLAMPTLAQRYQGRDHHVFHPPVQAKHQSAPSASNATRVSSVSGNPSISRGHNVDLSAPHNDTAHTQVPAATGPVRPR